MRALTILLLIPIIIIAFVLVQYLQFEKEAKEVYLKDLKEMLINKDVDRIEVVNRERVKIYLKPGKLDYYKKIAGKDFNKIPKEGPHFEMYIGDVNGFKEFVANAQKKLYPNEIVNINYKVDKNYLLNSILGISFPVLLIFIILLPFILWLIFLIDILKSDFKNSIDKLIWILIITFIPIIGLILYPFIGKKQRIKMPKN